MRRQVLFIDKVAGEFANVGVFIYMFQQGAEYCSQDMLP